MALLDTSDLLLDPEFADSLLLIKRHVVINSYGETLLTEFPEVIIAVVQAGQAEPKEKLLRTRQSARFQDGITVYYKGELSAQRAPDGYADIIVWRARRFQVADVDENFLNFGAGWSKAFCLIEEAKNG